MKKILKRGFLSILLKLIREESVRAELQRFCVSSSESFIRGFEYSPQPYTHKRESSKESAKKSLIITGRFRSGSTALWNVFRESNSFHAYYEPFNERQWFNPKMRGDYVDSSHINVKDYWSEYEGLERLVDVFDERWPFESLYMSEFSQDRRMYDYVRTLIDSTNKTPVLQFNRIDFRLPWFKKYFRESFFLHLYRNPRDQWCSFLVDKNKMNAKEVETTYEDNFYLYHWARDLANVFPELTNYRKMHPYFLFYLIWRLSYMYGQFYCDMSVSYEELANNPKNILDKVYQEMGLDSEEVIELSKLILKTEPDKYLAYAKSEWFEWHELQVEKFLSLVLGQT